MQQADLQLVFQKWRQLTQQGIICESCRELTLPLPMSVTLLPLCHDCFEAVTELAELAGTSDERALDMLFDGSLQLPPHMKASP